MGQGVSSAGSHQAMSKEQLGHILAEKFATKCLSQLELSHFKDNFFSLADEQDGIKYWKEETLCRFLMISGNAGAVVYQMATYIGAFPFPSLAPSILTFEAMVKVVVIMTERYKRVLKRGEKDKIALLFRSLAVFDKRASVNLATAGARDLDAQGETAGAIESAEKSSSQGFSIDQPAGDDDEEDEDDDELALAALEALDAIEVFRHDHRDDTKINHAQIPSSNFRELIILLLMIAPLGPQDSLSLPAEGLTEEMVQDIRTEADRILACFQNGSTGDHITYSAFTKTIVSSLPYLFEPFNAFFEHFLFSKNLNLSKKSGIAETPVADLTGEITALGTLAAESEILSRPILSHLSFTMRSPSGSGTILQDRTRFHRLYSTSTHGTSLTSFAQQIMTWRSPTILLVTSRASNVPEAFTIGIYLPQAWKSSSGGAATQPCPSSSDDQRAPSIILISPRHAVFPANMYNHTTPPAHFSPKTGISFGCIIPPSSRTKNPIPVPGPVSLLVDTTLENLTFTHSLDAGSGSFTPDASFAENLSSLPPSSTHSGYKSEMEIECLEVWGLLDPIPEDGSADDEISKQLARQKWEEAEAERRRGLNFGGDKEGARALLEMAGIVGDRTGGLGRSGGSV